MSTSVGGSQHAGTPDAPEPSTSAEQGRGHADGSAGRRPPSARAAVAVLVALLAFAAALHVGHVLRYRTVSPIDELQHLDYLIRAPRGEIVGSGDLFSQESARIQTCSRIDSPFDAAVPPCTTDPAVEIDVTRLQEGGYNTAYIHPPGYYAVDGVVARVIDAVVPGDQSLFTTGRLAGLVWTFAAVVFLWLLLAELRTGLLGRAAAIVIVISAPTVLHAQATINPDGTALALGAALLWTVLRWERGRLSAWVPIGLAALASATKVTNLVAVGVVVLYLLTSLLVQRRGEAPSRPAPEGPWWRRLPASVGLAVALVGATVVVAVAWAVVQRLVQSVDPTTLPMAQQFAITDFPWPQVFLNWQQPVSPFRAPYLGPFLRTEAVVVTASLVDLALMAGAVAGTVLAGRASRERRLGAVTLGLTVLLGPALVVFNAVVQSVYVDIPPRYGLALVPALAAAAAPALRRPAGAVLASGVAVLAGGAVLLAIAFPA